MRNINYSAKQVNCEMVSPSCLIYLLLKTITTPRLFYFLYIIHSGEVKYDKAKVYIYKLIANTVISHEFCKLFGITLTAPVFGDESDFICHKDAGGIFSSPTIG